MGYKSFQEKQLEMTHGIYPTNVRGQTNIANLYNGKYLINKIYSVYDIDLKSKVTKWPLNFFRINTFIFGKNAAFKVDSKNWIVAPFSVSQWDIYRNPYKIRISYINSNIYEGGKPNIPDDLLYREFIVGEEAVIFKAFDYYDGYLDLIKNTSNTLAKLDQAINTATTNNNVNFLAFAKNQNEANQYKKAYERATRGEPLIVISKDLAPEDNKALFNAFASNNPAAMLDKLLAARRGVMNNFLTEIGINNANIDKKERLNSMEVNSNSEEVSANGVVIYNNLKEAFDIFNDITGIGISIDLHYDYETKDSIIINEGGVSNGNKPMGDE